MSGPSVAELREVAQPASTMDRRSGEHWAGLLYMRRLSIYGTWLLVRTPLSPNQITGLMIVAGIAAGAVLALPGLWAAIGAALLIQLYLLLDCSDGEVARWTKRTSIAGVYLDRVGHYFSEAALLIGLGFRASGDWTPGWYTVLGFAAALGAILIKAETDLVDVARARSGLVAAPEAAAELRSRGLGMARRAAAALRFHRLIQAVELSLIALVTAVIDALSGGLAATRILVVACALVAGVQLVLHLVSILASRRLR
ncbi:CDP-alcohol phosphatidyltransferase family protein [Bailinhaonella thermotolerans]|uniref:CDP-alcohol phosphatidyltransferase family protein n=1 Tax=Bailinhaonella thermotolerans TaxID=1070861 RepID=A0A3A4AQ26_9ACTN|nr:CDP-alcohol phosphatidyltransferase family protein [Bailinhaonella thermotolerans]RJL30515.1 CDP-alcohol phosphatidyltransferase family protein [Bailinhaonella thermotolerans]